MTLSAQLEVQRKTEGIIKDAEPTIMLEDLDSGSGHSAPEHQRSVVQLIGEDQRALKRNKVLNHIQSVAHPKRCTDLNERRTKSTPRA